MCFKIRSLFQAVIPLFISLYVSCSYCQTKNFSLVEVQPLVQDSTLNVRALEIIKEQELAVFLTSDGRFGAIPLGRKATTNSVQNDAFIVDIPNTNQTLELNFRALSARAKHGYGISVGDPARLYRLDQIPTLVYEESHPKVFYDAMEFWNDQEGLAIGDPTEDCMSIIITRDAGQTWDKLSCDLLPKVIEGEAAFAASDTNIAIVGNHTWVATGGMASRVLYSPDKGQTWQIFETPIVQGQAASGMYSIEFYDENNGFAIGGDYTKPNDNFKNKIRTSDGGKTWHLVASGVSPDYRSCVKYVPNSNAKELVAVGYRGIDYSSDAGETWESLSKEGFYTIRFYNDTIAYAAGNGRIAKLLFK